MGEIRAIWLVLLVFSMQLVVFHVHASADAATASVEVGSAGEVRAPAVEAGSSAPGFTCGDGEVIDALFLNDDYCDCADGSDEPRTAACSLSNSASFTCTNKGYLTKVIPSSRVGDGICDCCDASDEVTSQVVCPSNCMEMGMEFRVEGVLQLVNLQLGLNIAAQAQHEALKAVHGWKVQGKKYQEELNALESLLEKVEARKYDEELLETSQRKERARAGAPAVPERIEEVVCPNDTRKALHMAKTATPAQKLLSWRARTVANCPTLKRLLDTRLGMVPKKRLSDPDEKERFLSSYQQRRHRGLGPYLNGGTEGLKLLGKRIVQGVGVLLYPVRLLIEGASWLARKTGSGLGFAGRAVASLGRRLYRSATGAKRKSKPSPAAAAEVQVDEQGIPIATASVGEDEDEAEAEGGLLHSVQSAWNATLDATKPARKVVAAYSRRLGFNWLYRTMWTAGPELWEYCFPTVDLTWVRPEAEELRKVLPELRSEVNSAKARLAEVDDKLVKTDGGEYGPGNRYVSLHDVCLDSHVEKYNYKVCFFNSVMQDGVSLGTWGQWQGEAQYYSDGASCWNNPARTATVKLSCGRERRLVEVREPSTCQYELEVEVPEACEKEQESAIMDKLRQLGMSDEEINVAKVALLEKLHEHQ